MREEVGKNNIIISSTGHFSKKKYNNCLINFDDNKIYNLTYDNEGKPKYEFYKDLNVEQKNKLISYITDNNLLEVSINNVVYDASDIIEINYNGKTNIIRNASREFTHNEMHIFDDIVNIVFNSDNTLNKIKNFFGFDLKSDKNIIRFAKEHGYEGAKYIGDWNEYKVYEPYIDEKNTSYSGLPLVILVNSNGEIRMSTSDEAFATLNDIAFMDSFEKNKNDEELNISDKHEVVNDPYDSGVIRKYKIDENGHEYEEIKKIEVSKCPNCNVDLLVMGNNKANLSCPKCKNDYMIFDNKLFPTNMTPQDINLLISNIDEKLEQLEKQQEEIDKKIEMKLDEVSKYSILNKSLEELIEAKKIFLDDWSFLLFNISDESWILKSGIYRVHIHSILEAILRKVEDNISKQQLELINQIGSAVSIRNKEELVRLVNDMKELGQNR